VTSYTVSYSNDGLDFFAYRVNGVVKVWINKNWFLEIIYTFTPSAWACFRRIRTEKVNKSGRSDHVSREEKQPFHLSHVTVSTLSRHVVLHYITIQFF
jgi:hypothetical protein